MVGSGARPCGFVVRAVLHVVARRAVHRAPRRRDVAAGAARAHAADRRRRLRRLHDVGVHPAACPGVVHRAHADDVSLCAVRVAQRVAGAGLVGSGARPCGFVVRAVLYVVPRRAVHHAPQRRDVAADAARAHAGWRVRGCLRSVRRQLVVEARTERASSATGPASATRAAAHRRNRRCRRNQVRAGAVAVCLEDVRHAAGKRGNGGDRDRGGLGLVHGLLRGRTLSARRRGVLDMPSAIEPVSEPGRYKQESVNGPVGHRQVHRARFAARDRRQSRLQCGHRACPRQQCRAVAVGVRREGVFLPRVKPGNPCRRSRNRVVGALPTGRGCVLVVPVPGVAGDGQPQGGRRCVVCGQRCRAESHARYLIRAAAALLVCLVGVLRAVTQAGERGGNRAGRDLAAGTVPGRRDALVPPVLVMPGDIQRSAAFADAACFQPLGGREHVVGECLEVVGVRRPQYRTVRPDASGPTASVVVARQVELLGLVARAGIQVVGVELGLVSVLILRHPHGRAVRPEVRGIVVFVVPVELLGLVSRAGRQSVGIYLVLVRVRVAHPLGIRVPHPHGDAVRPDALGVVVRVVPPGVQVELLARVARAGRQGVGE